MLLIYILLLLMIVIWGFSFILADIALDYIPPLSIALYRFIVASLSFLIIDIYLKINKKKGVNNKQQKEDNVKFNENDWTLIVIASFAGISLFFFAQYTAISLIGPSLPALFVCLLAPVIITLLALIFFNEKLTSLKIAGFIIASIGGFFLVTGGNIENLTPQSPNFIGYILALSTPLLWAVYATVTKKITRKKSNIKLLKYTAYLGTIELFILVIINGELYIFISNFFNILILLCALYLGVGCYVIGYYIWQYSQKNLKSAKVASFLYVEPFLTLFFSFILQRSEVIVVWNIIGGIIVLIAVVIINYES
ncbi:MAG: DMT family transporter [Promethearchaeota archaeon]